MKKLKMSKTKVLVLCMVILLCIPWLKCLRIISHSGQDQLILVQGIDSFEYTYTHSVTETKVREVYHMTTDNQIKPYQMIYLDHGAGLPDTVTSPERFREEDGAFVLDLDLAPIDSLNFMIIAKYNNQLHIAGKSYSMQEEDVISHSIKIEIKRINIISWLLKRLTG